MSYDPNFYDMINQGSLASAKEVVPVVLDLLGLTANASVVDFGCGEGAWLSVFVDHGCRVTGLDGAYVDPGRLLIEQADFVPTDLTSPVSIGRFGLAISLEVAEHLPAAAASSFIEAIASSSDIVLFSAAIPRQGGVGHLNEQWPAYWARLFEERGLRVSGGLRWLFWGNGKIENWYRQNMLLCMTPEKVKELQLERLFEGPENDPLPLIHPVLWDSRQ